jgi:hypothetical protein
MERLGYRNLLEKIAEKFHTTPATIIALNDPRQVLTAGTVLRLPNVLPASRSYSNVKPDIAQLLSDLNISGQQPKADRVVVDKSDKVVRVFGEGERLLAQFPATLGSEKDPLPLGNWKVNADRLQPALQIPAPALLGREDTEEEQMLRRVRTGRSAWSGSTSTASISESTAPTARRRSSARKATAAFASPIGMRRALRG